MTTIERNPKTASEKEYDLIVVGGGIYGVCLTFLAAKNGLKPLIVDKGDFGAETTYNSLRIVHGGLRYLQKLDIHRFFESVQERRWFFQNFPHLVEPMPCLMPLYGKGMMRRSIFGPAMMLNDVLSSARNKGVIKERHLPNAHLVSTKQVKDLYPGVDTDGLKGGAVWYDGSMPDSQIIILEILKAAVKEGAVALNYCEAKSLLSMDNQTSGLTALDLKSSESFDFKAPVVINSAGPWSRCFGEQVDKDYPELFHKSIAWNAVFDCDQLSSHALAITPKKPDASTYFVRPWKGKIFAGTNHEACSKDNWDPTPSDESVQNFIDDLNSLVTGLNLTQDNIVRFYSGFLPATAEGEKRIAVREVLMDHSETGGPKGLYSLSGVKFTTARLVAQKMLVKIFPQFKQGKLKSSIVQTEKDEFASIRSIENFDDSFEKVVKEDAEKLSKLAQKESAVHIDDFLFRRTSIGDSPERSAAAETVLGKTYDQADSERIKNHFYQK